MHRSLLSSAFAAVLVVLVVLSMVFGTTGALAHTGGPA
jgi:hypothetical protein